MLTISSLVGGVKKILIQKRFWVNNFDNDYFDVWEDLHPIIVYLLYTKKFLKKPAIAFWSSNLFLSIKSSVDEDFTFAAGSTDRIIFQVLLGLSFMVSNNVAKCCFLLMLLI